jgi:hypothetical protein
MTPGSLVVPVDNEEFMFDNPDHMDHEVDHISFYWTASQVGIILESRQLHRGRGRWFPIKVMVEGQVGWTYSDYVEVLG